MLLRSILPGGAFLLLLICLASAQPPGPGGPPRFGPVGPSQPGQVLDPFIQGRLDLSADQKKQVEELQKDMDARLAKLLTADQKKTFEELRRRAGNPGGPRGGGFGPPGPGGFVPFGPGGFGGPGRSPDPLGDVKKQIGATDEEWKVIGPKLQKVLAARRVLTADGRPAAGPFAGFAPSNLITQAQTELKNVLDDPKHTRADADEKIAAVRKARQKARADLDAAQKDLLLLLTPTQEAIMMSLGYLE